MEIRQVRAIYWSATGNTRKVTEILAGALAGRLGCPMTVTDVTPPAARQGEVCCESGELAVIGFPTYAGKLPNKLLPWVQEQLRGNGALAVCAVTFGNRSYDNALAELCAAAEAGGFHTVAGGAFACRHAFSDKLAPGRPGETDLEQIDTFAELVAGKVAGLTDIPAPITVPGDAAAPYYIPKGTDGQPAKFLKAKPLTDMDKCTNCGDCARLCPMGSIDPENVAEVPGVCIKCQACVRGCPAGAKYFDDPAFLSHVAMLEQNYTAPRENEVFA